MTLLVISLIIFVTSYAILSLVEVNPRNGEPLFWGFLIVSGGCMFLALKASFATPDPNIQAAGFTLPLLMTVILIRMRPR